MIFVFFVLRGLGDCSCTDAIASSTSLTPKARIVEFVVPVATKLRRVAIYYLKDFRMQTSKVSLEFNHIVLASCTTSCEIVSHSAATCRSTSGLTGSQFERSLSFFTNLSVSIVCRPGESVADSEPPS
jgi:hypothetical protein